MATWIPKIIGSTKEGSGDYTIQNGYYARINLEEHEGNLLYVSGKVSWKNHSGKGSLIISLPVGVRSLPGYEPSGIFFGKDLAISGGGVSTFMYFKGGSLTAIPTIIRQNAIREIHLQDSGEISFSGLYLT